MRSALGALALLVLACAGAGGGGGGDDGESFPDTVTLRFDWAGGSEARVETRRRVHKRSDGADRSYAFDAAYTQRAESLGDRLRIATLDFQLKGVDRDTLGAAASTDGGVLARDRTPLLTLIAPTLVVDAEAEVLDVEGLEALSDFWHSHVPEPAPGDVAGQRIWEFVYGGVFSEQAFRMRAALVWDRLVGAWAGAELALGETYVSPHGGEFMLFPGVTFPVSVEVGALSRVGCGGGRGSDCVRLRLRHAADPDRLAVVLSESLRRMSPESAGDWQVHSYVLESEVELLTEPDTLRPHRALLRDHSRLVMQGGGEGLQEYDKVTETEYRWRW